MQNIDASAIFNFLSVFGAGVQTITFDTFQWGCGADSQTTDFKHPRNPCPPAIYPPTHLIPVHTPFALFTTPPVCSWQANCARLASSLTAILDSIVGAP